MGKHLINNAPRRSDYNYIIDRVKYYNKLDNNSLFTTNTVSIKDIKRGDNASSYYFDTVEICNYFNPKLRVALEWGDVTYIPEHPAIVKSRPINGANENSILMKLNKNRHFTFVNDKMEWEEKMDRVIFRGKIPGKEKRVRFFELYFHHKLVNLGDTSRNGRKEWNQGKMTINEQLKYKFILALEGNDVASNLKWVMSSNSIAVMPTPEFETWFMEGRLIPNYHYIHIADDYSNLEERINYYINHPDEAKKIIRNANEYVNQFRNNHREHIISLLTLEKTLTSP
ncbi:MAG: glycosyl transferase family 90 [Bacteroidales bacterium]